MCDVECGGTKSLYCSSSQLRTTFPCLTRGPSFNQGRFSSHICSSRSGYVPPISPTAGVEAYARIFSKACFWTLTACEVVLIWSVSHLRSPVAHRFLVFLVHPFANFPPNLRISLPFAVSWSISTLSLAIHFVLNSYHRRTRQSSTSPNPNPVHHVPKRRIQTTRRVVHGSNVVMAIGSTSCFVGPGSFAYECLVWRLRFGGTLLCFMGVLYVVFWLVVVCQRCVGSQDDGRMVSEPVEEVPSSDASLEEGAETEGAN